MLKYIGRRLLTLIPVVLALSLITFGLSAISAGDAARVLAEKEYNRPTLEEIEITRHKHGLDRPFLVRYGAWLGKALRGDLGVSYTTDKPVARELALRFPKTLQLALLSMAFLVLITFPFGILSAVFPDSWIDRVGRGFSFFSVSMPPFWLGLLLLYIFGARLRVISVIGGSAMRYPILPALTLAVTSAGIYIRLIRQNMLEELQRPYIRAARAKGVAEWKVIGGHALKNAVMPVLNKLGIGFCGLLCGSSIIESIFSWNGIGKLALDSVPAKDTPVLLGYVILMALFVVVVNLAVDVFCSLIDPRLKAQ